MTIGRGSFVSNRTISRRLARSSCSRSRALRPRSFTPNARAGFVPPRWSSLSAFVFIVAKLLMWIVPFYTNDFEFDLEIVES